MAFVKAPSRRAFLMLETMLMQAKGINGTLELWPDHIRIKREGWTSWLYNRDSRGLLSLSDIHSIELREVAGGLAGFLAFNDGTDPDCVDDMCVSFLKYQEPAFKAICALIQQRREQLRAQPDAHSKDGLSTRQEHYQRMF
jgi:hypothetical protein